LLSHLNTGLRYLLCLFPMLSIAAAQAVMFLCRRARLRPVAAALLLWLTISSLISHPDYLPYFNELAGSHPENILVDSDLDWGQDLKRLSTRLKEVGAKEVMLLTPYIADYEKEHGIPHRLDKMNVFYPSPGWCAISVSYLKES